MNEQIQVEAMEAMLVNVLGVLPGGVTKLRDIEVPDCLKGAQPLVRAMAERITKRGKWRVELRPGVPYLWADRADSAP